MTNEERLANVGVHVNRLQELLDRPAQAGVSQRIYRTRGIIGGEYLVITLVQYLPGYSPSMGTPDVRVRLYVSRPYTHTSFGATPLVQTALIGQYATDEIVAFLALDTVDPGTIEWTDETRYNNLLVVSDILPRLHG